MKYISLDVETGGILPAHYSLLEIGLVTDNLQAPNTGTYPSGRVVILDSPVRIDPVCITMHRKLLEEIAHVGESDWFTDLVEANYTFGAVSPDQPEAVSPDYTCYSTPEGAPEALRHVLDHLNVPWRDETLVVAGKNVGVFDLPFLEAYGLLDGSEARLAQASKDPATRAQQITEATLDGYPPIRFAHRTLDPAILYVQPGDSRPPDLATCLERAGLEPTASHTAVGDALDVVRALRARLLS